MKAAIIEDEDYVAESLEKQLRKIDSSIEIMKRLGTIRDSVVWLKQNEPDLIFLDIHLSDGLSFKIFEEVEVNIPVIFTTAYDQYAIKAFKLNSIDYLLKPINETDLQKSLGKFKSISQYNTLKGDAVKKLIDYIENKKVEYVSRFMVKAGQHIQSVKTSEIAYFYTEAKGVSLKTYGGKSYSIDYTLDRLENILDPKHFFRISRKFIIHIDSIAKMYNLSKSRIQVELNPPCEYESIVSFNRSAAFKRWLGKF